MIRIFFLISFFCLADKSNASAQNISTKDSLAFQNLLDSIQDEMSNNTVYAKERLFALQKVKKWRNSPYFKSVLFSMLGSAYHRESKLDSAKYYYEKALIIREKNNFKASLASTYQAIASLHESYGEDSIALNYLYRSLVIKKEINDQRALAPIFSHIGVWHFNQSNFDSSLYYYNKAGQIFKHLNDSLAFATNSSNIGSVYFMQDKNNDALVEFRKGLTIRIIQKDSALTASSFYSIGGVYDWVGNNDSALYFFSQAKNYLEPTGNKGLLGQIYQALAETYVKDNNADSSIYYFNAYTAFRDSIFNSDKAASFLEFETKYKTKEKEQALLIESTKNTEKQRTIVLLTISLAGLIVSLLFIFRYFRQKKKVSALEISIKNQEIDKLLKEQESSIYMSLLQGQQDERNRISQDLHDRIGGTLAALKVHFELASNDNKQNDNDDYTKLVTLVDEAVTDVRNISHDLASDKLASYGLTRTLSQLVETINASKSIQFNLYIANDISFSDIKVEQEIYSIIQELLSNTLKHANAKIVDLSINAQENMVNILFEDDGIGFETSNTKDNGLGITGIKTRVANLNGEIHLDSTIGRGSIFNINIPE